MLPSGMGNSTARSVRRHRLARGAQGSSYCRLKQRRFLHLCGSNLRSSGNGGWNKEYRSWKFRGSVFRCPSFLPVPAILYFLQCGLRFFLRSVRAPLLSVSSTPGKLSTLPPQQHPHLLLLPVHTVQEFLRLPDWYLYRRLCLKRLSIVLR